MSVHCLLSHDILLAVVGRRIVHAKDLKCVAKLAGDPDGQGSPKAMSDSSRRGQIGICGCANGMADVIVVVMRENGEGIPIDLKLAAKYYMSAAVVTHRKYKVQYGGVCI